MTNNLNHLAIIMDGNSRWASKHNKTRAQGHKAGAETAKKLLPYTSKLGIKHLTLYAFSSENWQRPINEVSILINLLSYYVKNEIQTLNDHQIKLKIIGDLSKLSPSLQQKIHHATEETKHNSKLTVTIAFSYGSRNEIVNACQKAINSGIKTITEDDFKNFLYEPKMPDVDLLIRTSGVYRISNFLLWQSAYAELYFTDKLWPDFNEEDLSKALEDYSQRTRNFGGRNE